MTPVQIETRNGFIAGVQYAKSVIENLQKIGDTQSEDYFDGFRCAFECWVEQAIGDFGPISDEAYDLITEDFSDQPAAEMPIE